MYGLDPAKGTDSYAICTSDCEDNPTSAGYDVKITGTSRFKDCGKPIYTGEIIQMSTPKKSGGEIHRRVPRFLERFYTFTTCTT